MPELERWVLHRLTEMDALIRNCIDAYDFHSMFTALHNFCAVDLSSFYFDVRKDSFYCDAPGSLRRRAARTVLDELFSCLTAWLAPVVCFTAGEAGAYETPATKKAYIFEFSRKCRMAGGMMRSPRSGIKFGRYVASSPARWKLNVRRNGSVRACRRHLWFWSRRNMQRASKELILRKFALPRAPH